MDASLVGFHCSRWPLLVAFEQVSTSAEDRHKRALRFRLEKRQIGARPGLALREISTHC